MTDKPLPSMVELTPFNPVYQANPHEVLDDLRDRCPAHRDATSGSLILTRYADVRGVVNNRDLWRDPIRAEEGAIMQRRFLAAVPQGVPRTHVTSILTLDDPDHARSASPWPRPSTPGWPAPGRPGGAIVAQALDSLEDETEFDLMDRFCVPIPIDAIARILGVDHDRLVEFRAGPRASSRVSTRSARRADGGDGGVEPRP
jgi:cytochrome P450